MSNALHDPQTVQSIHSEYLKLVNYYQNTKRPSSFVRYYNIDVDNSTFDEKLEATYDLYHNSTIRFNLYDFTPTYFMNPIVNATSNVQDQRGQTLDATTSIVTFSIEKPKVNDLVMFYGPIKSGEIFRVINFRTPVNALHSDPKWTWFELDLEYAPLLDTQSLKMLNHYVYNLSTERYDTYNEYISFTSKLNDIETILAQLATFYDPFYDLYQYGNLVPVETNEAIIFVKKLFAIKFQRLLEKFFLPYGYLDSVNDSMKYTTIDDLPFKRGNHTYNMYNLVTKTYETYTWSFSNDISTTMDNILALTVELLVKVYDWQIDE